MAPTNRSPFRRTLALMASAAILAHAGMNGVAYGQIAPETTAPGVATPAPATPVPTPPATAAPQPAPSIQAGAPNNGPASVADLAEGLLDAVVNISTSQNVKDDEGVGPAPRAPDGSPFQEFFNDFFDKKQGNKGGNHNVSSLGSGFVIDPTGYIVTNNHVIEGADDIEVNFANGSKLKAKLIGTDTKTDLSVLKVEPKSPLKSVKFGDSSTMRIGDWVMAIGNPFGFGGSVTVGIISGRGRNINAGPYDNFIQTDAAINKGNSGGPLFNMKGEVIGINTAIISPSGGSIGIGFSVPSELASGVVDQLREYGETRRGWLGVRIQPVTDDIADSLGLDTAKGALVAGVIKGGPVDDGSIKAGDVILKFDGKTVSEMRDLPRVVAESTVGKEVDVVVLRDGKEQTVKVKLGRLEDSDQAAASGDAAPDGSQDDGVITPDPGENNDMDEPDSGDQAQPAPGAPAPDQHQGQVSPDAATPKNVLGLSLSLLSAETRKAFGIAESVDGVVVTEVTPGSASAEKGLKPGDVIVEVAQEFMKSPDAVAAKVKSLKQEGRRNAQLMIASANGDLRFVAVPME
ncbi:serine protease [Rhizobium leguminosarum bv. trifolii CB782]|uniref:Probable periplasmic serine endoprotease DegP-like n=1 Tax=Rhizobium hidalgonense TaxID=1538159 RepID=A0A2A6KFE7_9HYPH|nr:Do family serine endopeptidase [Rhizobium hidalgonense]AHG46083.1 serine protease [Rhizobium leguminosarum bv. trifolii CB782]EJC75785.1 periplasmic serine protease, Do/DeqQ family [Rhizobium leguminosarum bv. trifolii WSM2012]EJC76883.1 periplasmic serine protease, Do/DeqQ family [Rhizobium leguminosarum bv. trifolii WSM2012]MDR9772554.1 Do family serine endopeptidase [Rhizobium hidalgonense]MDR9813902.1 Do family serine endopeptidase [Rhizobium hidalgonense]